MSQRAKPNTFIFLMGSPLACKRSAKSGNPDALSVVRTTAVDLDLLIFLAIPDALFAMPSAENG